jgi:hypothetical protein
MNILASSIRAYQRSRIVNRAVRAAVHTHHRLRPDTSRGPCPLAGQCSKEGLAAAQALGMAALPAILARMAACGRTRVGPMYPRRDYGDC